MSLRRYIPVAIVLVLLAALSGKLLLTQVRAPAIKRTKLQDEAGDYSLAPITVNSVWHGEESFARGWPWVFLRTTEMRDPNAGAVQQVSARFNFWLLSADLLLLLTVAMVIAWSMLRYRRVRGRWLQFSLRGLLIMTLLIGLALGWALRESDIRKRETVALRTLPDLYENLQGYSVGFADMAYCGPEWLRRIWREDDLEFYQRVVRLEIHYEGEQPVPAEETTKFAALLESALLNLPFVRDLNTEVDFPFEQVDSKAFARIEELHFAPTQDRTLAALKHWPSLATLEIYDFDKDAWPQRECHFTDAALTYLGECAALESVTLPLICSADKQLACLGSMKRLRSVTMSFPYGSRLTQAELRRLVNVAPIQELVLSGTEIEENALEPLGRLPELESVSLRGCDGVTDAELRHLANLHKFRALKLRALSLGGREVTGEGFAAFSKSTKLEYLDLGSSPISQQGIRRVAALPELRCLKMKRDQVADGILGELAESPTLEEVDLDSCKAFTDAGIARLAESKSIRILQLYNTEISDKSLEPLSKMPALEKLQMENCTKLTERGILKLLNSKSLKMIVVPKVLSPASIDRLKSRFQVTTSLYIGMLGSTPTNSSTEIAVNRL